MGLFKKLFPKPAPEPLPAPLNPADDPEMIRVHDAYGREVFLTRDVWRKEVLPENLRANWDNADALYAMIVAALNDNFRAEVVDAAKHLHEIDPSPLRGACIWGVVLMEENRLDEAEAIFNAYTAAHGEDATILTNLAKVWTRRGDQPKADAILWHALELDPNQDNALGWYRVLGQERGGDNGAIDALHRVALLPGSWRPQLWLARAALERRNLEAAMVLYRQALSRAGDPVPADALMQISGDLGNTGNLIPLLELTIPRFSAAAHGLAVGNNLIKAHLDLGQLDAARAIMDQLYALNRPDWKSTLGFWDTELAKMRVSIATPLPQEQLRVAMLTIDGPIWLRPDSPASELYPPRAVEAPKVAFLGSTVESSTNPDEVVQQLADAQGRMSRALPLWLAERAELAGQARAHALIPWIANGSGGFLLAGGPFSNENAAASASQSGDDYVVITHLKTGDTPWKAEVRLVRTIDATCLGTAEATFDAAQPWDGLLALAESVKALIARELEQAGQALPDVYAAPGGGGFGNYLLRLEQLLAVRCAATHSGAVGSFLNGERDILDGNLQQCLAYPASVSVRLLAAQTLLTMRRVRPDILPEFKGRVELLQRDLPLPEPAQSVAGRLFGEAMGAA